MTRTESPEVSVVVVSYRCAEHLRRCLRSLDGQRDSVAIEVIVIDNASGDGTGDVARRWAHVRLVECDGNSGFARAANAGIARATGRAVLVLNPDTAVPRGALRACLNALWADRAIGVLSPRVVDAEGDFDHRCRRGFPSAWSSACFIFGLDRLWPSAATCGYLKRHLPQMEPCDVDTVSGAFMLMPADVVRAVGGFDQQFFMYAEDIDLCMRIKESGLAVRYWPEVTVEHAGGGSGRSMVDRRRAEAAAHRTMAPLIRKHQPGPGGWLMAGCAVLAGELLLAFRRISRLATRIAQI